MKKNVEKICLVERSNVSHLLKKNLCNKVAVSYFLKLFYMHWSPPRCLGAHERMLSTHGRGFFYIAVFYIKNKGKIIYTRLFSKRLQLK